MKKFQMRQIFFLLFMLGVLNISNGHKILIYNPRMAYSHVNFVGKIADALADAGHDVTVLQPLMSKVLTSSGSTKAKVIEVKVDEEKVERQHVAIQEIMKDIWTLPAAHPIGVIAPVPMMTKGFSDACREVLEKKDLLSKLKAEKFDVGVTELFDFSAFAYFHAIGLTNIVGSHSTGLLEMSAIQSGVPILPSYMPASMGVTPDDTSFYTRTLNTVFTLCSYYFEYANAKAIQVVMDDVFGKDAPNIWQQVDNITWYLTNSEPLIDFPKPTLHTVIELGGIGVSTAKPLTKEWDDILNLRKKTVLVSFGSVAPSILMTAAMKSNLVNNFAKHPDVTFIWKYEKPEDNIAAGVSNIILSKWTPQNDLLADPRLTAFITHGGAGSIYEAATYGKPLLAIPLFGDQSRNAHMVARLGMAVFYLKADLDKSDLFNKALNRLLTDKSIPESAQRVSKILAARPVTSQQKVVSTIEMAAAFGQQPLLRPAGVSLGYIAYYNIDVLFVFTVIIMIVVALIISLLVCCIRRICSSKKAKKE